MTLLAEVVNWEALRDVVIASLIAGVGVTLCFSLAILGGTRFSDMRREERHVGAAFYGLLGLVGLGASLAVIGVAIFEMTSKG